MEAIRKLVRAGYTRQQIAEQLPGTSGVALVRLYERGKRFPSKENYACVVRLAEARGLNLLARDFLDVTDQCNGIGEG